MILNQNMRGYGDGFYKLSYSLNPPLFILRTIRFPSLSCHKTIFSKSVLFLNFLIGPQGTGVWAGAGGLIQKAFELYPSRLTYFILVL